MASLSGKTILLIDDAEDVRLLARRILEVDGAVVDEAPSVDAALASAKDKIPHLIVLDLEMPEKSGFDFLDHRLGEARFRGIPTIVLSGRRDRASVQKALSLGADDYVLKPFRATLMLQKVRKALRLSSFYVRKTKPGEDATARMTIASELVAVNEVGCAFESPVKLGPDEEVILHSGHLKELGAEGLRMRTTKATGRFIGGGRYAGEVAFVGIDRELAAKIRRRIGGAK